MSYVVSPWKRTRFWAVTDRTGKLVAVTVYKKGATEVKRILENASGYLPQDPVTTHRVGMDSVVS